MPYVPRGDTPRLTPEVVEQLAHAVGMPLLPGDAEAVAGDLSDQLAASKLLARLTVGGADRTAVFDADWTTASAQSPDGQEGHLEWIRTSST